MDYLIKALQQNPELAIFLALAIGFAIGRVKLGSFSLGTVVGTLFAGVLIGQFDVKVPALVKTVFFDLFLFTTGYKVGPQFFRGLKRDALSQVTLTLVLCTTCLAAALIAAKLFDYDIGTAAGLLAGAFTESTVIGTAGDAINRLAISEEEKAHLLNNIPVAYAVTYLVGTTAVVWFLPTIGPKLMGVNLKEEAKKMQAQVSGGSEEQPGIISPSRAFDVRAYRVTNEKLVNKSIAEIEAMPQEVRVFIQRIRRGGAIIEAEPTTIIHLGDVIAVMARAEILVERSSVVGPEVTDKQLLDFPLEVLDVVVTNKDLVDKTFKELSTSEPWRMHFRGVFVRKLLRAGAEMPITMTTQVERGDLLSLVGAKRDIDRAVAVIGYADWPSNATDMIFVGTGIFIGGLVGLAYGDCRRAADHAYRQRRRPHHGISVRLAALCIPCVRPHSRSRDVGFRHRRVERLYWSRRIERGSEFYCRVAKIRHKPGFRRFGGGCAAAHCGHFIRSICLTDEPGYPSRGLFGCWHDDRGAARNSGRGTKQTAGPGLHGSLCRRQYRAHRLGTGYRRIAVDWKVISIQLNVIGRRDPERISVRLTNG